jgi:hypothetical protein
MSDQANNISFQQSGIAETLKRFGLFVPRYQRDYSWEADETTEYLHDVANAITQDEPVYFLGSLVVIIRDNLSREVIDGQQRLATTSLLLAAMRHLSPDGSPIQRALDPFIVSLEIETMDQVKMTLNDMDSGVFNSLISTGEPGEGFIRSRPSHKKLAANYKICRDFMEKQAASVGERNLADHFKKWLKYIQHNVTIILIEVTSELNAFRMFETLNDRGLKVSQADLIKNHLFSQSGDSIVKAQALWVSTTSSLEAIEQDEATMNFIRHMLMATNKFVQRKYIYRDVQVMVRGENSANDMLERLDQLSIRYAALHNSESPVWKAYPAAIKEHIKVINLFNIQPLKPLLLAASAKLSESECEKLFGLAISMSVRLTIASVSRTTSQAVEGPIAETARKIWSEDITTARAAVKSIGSAIPNDAVFSDGFLTATVAKPALARYYLRTIERAAKNEESPSHIPNEDASTVNLEHIFPSNPYNNWPEFDESESQTYLKRIGNLALLVASDNELAGSESFEVKSKIYSNSTFVTTEMISSYEKWIPDSIRSRQRSLMEYALRAWPLS